MLESRAEVTGVGVLMAQQNANVSRTEAMKYFGSPMVLSVLTTGVIFVELVYSFSGSTNQDGGNDGGNVYMLKVVLSAVIFSKLESSPLLYQRKLNKDAMMDASP